jgi:polar amino acid transport system substrate-binding protein
MARLSTILTAIAVLGLLSVAPDTSAQTVSDLQKIKERKVVRVGAAAAFPYYERAVDGTWKGLIPDLMQPIAQALGVSVEYVDTTWGTAAAGLQSDRFDIMGAFNKTPERALAVDFTRPIGSVTFGLLSLTDRSKEFTSWASVDRKDVRLAAVDGTSTYRTMEKQLTSVQWILVQNFETLLLELDSGRSPVALCSSTEAKNYIDRRNRGVFIIPTPVQSSATNLALRKSADPKFREALDAIIDNLEKQGQLEKIWAKYSSPAK